MKDDQGFMRNVGIGELKEIEPDTMRQTAVADFGCGISELFQIPDTPEGVEDGGGETRHVFYVSATTLDGEVHELMFLPEHVECLADGVTEYLTMRYERLVNRDGPTPQTTQELSKIIIDTIERLLGGRKNEDDSP